MLAQYIKRAPRQGALLVGIVLSIGWAAASSGAQLNSVVEYVIDGDTVVLQSGRKVRLIGLNSPEKAFENRSSEPYSLEARLALAELMQNQDVIVIPGQDSVDRYGRTLAYLKLSNGADVQELMLSRGYAAAITLPPNVENITKYLQAESAAKKQGRGLWKTGLFQVDLDQDDAADLHPGFKIISGTITDYRTSKRNRILSFGKQLSLLISHKNWKRYWDSQSFEKLVGEQVEARGWVIEKGEHKWLTIKHPSMLLQK